MNIMQIYALIMHKYKNISNKLFT